MIKEYQICRVLSPDNTLLAFLELYVFHRDGVVGTQHPTKKVEIC